MPLYVPSDEVTEIHVGSTELSKYYVGSNEIWSSVPPYVPYTPANAVNRGNFPSGGGNDSVTDPQSITYDGTQFIFIDAENGAVWTLANVASPGSAVRQGFLFAILAMTWDGMQIVVIVDFDTHAEIITIADVTRPNVDVSYGQLPIGLASSSGMAWDPIGMQLVIVDKADDDLWTLARNADGTYTPGNARREGALPSGLQRPEGITYDGIRFVIVDHQGREIWTLDDVTSPGTAVSQGQLPNGLRGPRGITWDSANSQLVIVDTQGDELFTLARN